jgi:hypothetical protein
VFHIKEASSLIPSQDVCCICDFIIPSWGYLQQTVLCVFCSL